MYGTDASIHEPGDDPEFVAAPPGSGSAPDPVVADAAPDRVAPGDDADLGALEADLDTVDAALEALDADDLDAAEALVASLTDDGDEHGDDAEPPPAPRAPAG
jgi:hypothetical protein